MHFFNRRRSSTKNEQADTAERSDGNAAAATNAERHGNDNAIEAPTNVTDHSTSQKTRRRSSIFSKRTTENKKERKQSLSDSGPYIFAFDPRIGKTVLQKNPHWPYEDSWKREEENASSKHA